MTRTDPPRDVLTAALSIGGLLFVGIGALVSGHLAWAIAVGGLALIPTAFLTVRNAMLSALREYRQTTPK